MSSSQRFTWAETEMAKLTSQLVNIGVQIDSARGTALGVTAPDVTHWKRGSAVLVYAGARLETIRGYSIALTNWRDNFLLDLTPERLILPALTLPPIPAEVQAAFDDPNFLTDYLDWCDKLVGTMEKNGLTDADRQQFGLLIPPPPIPKDQMVAAVRSIHEHPGGAIEVNADRKNQAQVKATVTLDSGEVLEKTLPSAKIPFQLPTDRVHAFTAVTQFADKLGNLFGQPSPPMSGRSEL